MQGPDIQSSEPNPGLIFNTLNAHQQSAALRGAIELDLFTVLAKGHRTASPHVPAAFSLMMLATTPAGDAYTFAQYDAMWSKAGLASNELIDVPESEQRVILSKR